MNKNRKIKEVTLNQKISSGTVARTIVLAISLLNQLLTMNGKNPLPFADEAVYQGVTATITVVSSLVAWWKNNSFTGAAIQADDMLTKIKKGE